MSLLTTSCCCRHAPRSSRTKSPLQRPIIQLRNASTSYAFSRRHTIASSRQHRRQRRWQSTESVASAAASSDNPKISSIVDQIGQLTLLETADLVQSLKTKLSIPDLPLGGGFAAAAPAPPGSSAQVAEAGSAEEDAAPTPAAKTLFTLKLESSDAAAKPKIIKEIKSMLGLSLVESKKFVESAPKVMKEGVPKEEAEKIVKGLEGLGGKVTME